MRFKLLCFSLVCLLIFSCKTDTQIQEVESALNDKQSKRITKGEIQSLKYNDYGLSKEASIAVNDWQKYQEINTQIEYLKTGDLSFFKTDISLVTTFINDFKAEIPKSLSTNEINSRIIALETKILKLNSLLLLDNISKKDQIEGIKEVLVAFSNLNLQVNKKLEFEANNIIKPD
jgi:hypothetical protein